MCLTWCHKRSVLIDTDTDDVCGMCVHNLPPAGGIHCATCCHKAGSVCQATGAPLPERLWCCHHDVSLNEGQLTVTTDHLRGALRFVEMPHVLDLYGAVYCGHGPDGSYSVELESLSRPAVFGVSTVHWEEALYSSDDGAEPVEAWTDGQFILSL